MKPTLTLKQKRFIEFYKKDPTNIVEAARKAGYKDRNAGYQTMQNDAVRATIQEFRNQVHNEIPDEILIAKLKAGLEAKKVIGGKIFPDYATQLRYLELAHRIKFPEIFSGGGSKPELPTIDAKNIVIRYLGTDGRHLDISPLRKEPYDPND